MWPATVLRRKRRTDHGAHSPELLSRVAEVLGQQPACGSEPATQQPDLIGLTCLLADQVHYYCCPGKERLVRRRMASPTVGTVI
jgi:hypothetical protein